MEQAVVMPKETTYPIAEHFVSPQGEGFHVGELMLFLRLAGCNVGKPFTKEERAVMAPFPVHVEKCHSIFGNSFSCDTNFRMSVKMTLDAILDRTDVQETERICITGGEPLMHDIYPLLFSLFEMDKRVHIETSGTKSFRHLQELAEDRGAYLWVACSPKQGCLEESIANADELKILVDEHFDEEEFLDTFEPSLHKVWLQPINGEHSIDKANVDRCLALQKKYPKTRISIQLHKILCVQ